MSGQELNVVVGIRFPRGTPRDHAVADLAVASRGKIISGSACRQASYATHQENDAQPRNREVDRAVAELYAARARAEATEANREGRYERARHVLEATAARIRQYAGDDVMLKQLARSIREEVPVYAEAPMSPVALKMSMYVAEASAKGRDRSGRARRTCRRVRQRALALKCALLCAPHDRGVIRARFHEPANTARQGRARSDDFSPGTPLPALPYPALLRYAVRPAPPPPHSPARREYRC